VTGPLRDFADRYARALDAYLLTVNEAALQAAYELGRQAIGDQVSVLDIVWVHHNCLGKLLHNGQSGTNLTQASSLASNFLSECLAPVEMTQRGFRDTITALSRRALELAETNTRLEEEIRERKKWAEALRRSELLFRSLFENSSDVITIVNEDGTIRSESPSIERVLGYTVHERIGASVFESIHPDDLPEVESIFRAALRIPNHMDARTFRARHSDGSWRIIESVGKNLLSIPGVGGILVSSRDITYKVEMQHKLDQASRQREDDARRFALGIQQAQEDERQRIARELHDDICQRLTALRLNVNLLEDGSHAIIPVVRKELRSMKLQLDGMIADVRRMSAHLRPMALDLFGLITAMRILCEQVQKAFSLTVTFETSLRSDERFEAQLEIAMYRIAQEALNNAGKHSRAKDIYVSLETEEMKLRMAVRDTGMGFSSDSKELPRNAPGGFGLVNMRERAELCGGIFRIESRPGHGTTVHIELPLTLP
jgi:PAS domain S-box-containing protein